MVGVREGVYVLLFGECGLFVEGHGVIHAGGDFFRREPVPYLVAIFAEYGVHVPHRFGVRGRHWGGYGFDVFEGFGVSSGDEPAFLVPGIQTPEFVKKYGGLEGVEAVVVPHEIVDVFASLGPSVVYQATGFLGGFRVPGDYGSGVAPGAQVFAGVEGEGGCIPGLPGAEAVSFGSMGLGGVFDYYEVVMIGDLPNPAHVGHLSP